MADTEPLNNEADYVADQPYEGEFDVPDFVVILQNELQEVRTQIGKLEQQLWPLNYWKRPLVEQLTEPAPILKIRLESSLAPLRTEEERLMSQLRAVQWIIPPLMEAPYNGKLTAAKAKKILEDGTIRGVALTPAQKHFFGWVAGGGHPKKR